MVIEPQPQSGKKPVRFLMCFCPIWESIGGEQDFGSFQVFAMCRSFEEGVGFAKVVPTANSLPK